MVAVDDQELINNCLNGDQNSFEELVTRYKKIIYSSVSYYIKDTEEAKDISQEVFLRIYKSLKTYNAQYKFSTWSVRIARNLCLDHIRRNRIHYSSLDEYENLSRDDDTPETRYITNERTSELRRQIEKLPEKYKTLLLLYHQKGLSYKEMAEKLQEPMSIIKNRLYRARLAMKENILRTENILWN